MKTTYTLMEALLGEADWLRGLCRLGPVLSGRYEFGAASWRQRAVDAPTVVIDVPEATPRSARGAPVVHLGEIVVQ